MKCQNSGVLVKCEVSSSVKEYYGVLTDVYKFSFVGGNEVFLFKCKWWDVGHKGVGFKSDKWGFTYINSSRYLNTNEVFVLATQCEQVDYIEDMKDSVWLAVNKTTPRDLYFSPSIVDNNEVPDDESLNNEAAYQEDVP